MALQTELFSNDRYSPKNYSSIWLSFSKVIILDQVHLSSESTHNGCSNDAMETDDDVTDEYSCVQF